MGSYSLGTMNSSLWFLRRCCSDISLIEEGVAPPILRCQSLTSPVIADLLGVPVEDQVIIAKALLVHVSVEILRSQTKTPFIATLETV